MCLSIHVPDEGAPACLLLSRPSQQMGLVCGTARSEADHPSFSQLKNPVRGPLVIRRVAEFPGSIAGQMGLNRLNKMSQQILPVVHTSVLDVFDAEQPG